MKTRTRHFSAIAALTLALTPVLAPAAAAQLAKTTKPMTRSEVADELLGIDMTGYSITFGMHWRECIDPGGQTLYQTPGGIQKGRMRILEDGSACFAYDDTSYTQEGCFEVTRRGKGYQFRGLRDGGVFATTSILRGVESCKPADDLIS